MIPTQAHLAFHKIITLNACGGVRLKGKNSKRLHAVSADDEGWARVGTEQNTQSASRNIEHTP